MVDPEVSARDAFRGVKALANGLIFPLLSQSKHTKGNLSQKRFLLSSRSRIQRASPLAGWTERCAELPSNSRAS